MSFSENTDISSFSYEDQDALLAEMQRQALRDFRQAASVADRAHATTAFAQAAKARQKLAGIIGARRANQRLTGECYADRQPA